MKKAKLLKESLLAYVNYEGEKIVQAAFSKTRSGKPDLKNMLDVERKLFDSIVDILIWSRKRFFSED